jgi:hypothetical protein
MDDEDDDDDLVLLGEVLAKHPPTLTCAPLHNDNAVNSADNSFIHGYVQGSSSAQNTSAAAASHRANLDGSTSEAWDPNASQGANSGSEPAMVCCILSSINLKSFLKLNQSWQVGMHFMSHAVKWELLQCYNLLGLGFVNVNCSKVPTYPVLHHLHVLNG